MSGPYRVVRGQSQIHDQLDELKSLFSSVDFPQNLRSKALKADLKNTCLRSLAWKVFLGCHSEKYSESVWKEESSKWREVYVNLRKQFHVNPSTVIEQPNVDLSIHNPLAPHPENKWNEFFKNSELQQTIKQDLSRLYPEFDFFQDEGRQEVMLRILFVWCTLHSRISYRQGMHELLAPIIYIVEQEAIVESDEAGPLSFFLNKEYVEHDAFALFSKLMEPMGGLFEQPSAPARKPTRNTSGLSMRGVLAPEPERPPDTPLLKKCYRIHHELLAEVDVDLYSHLQSQEIEPQIYAMRWVRLLFGREFHLEDLLILWDAIFADSKGLELSDYICLAMLVFIRGELLSGDSTKCLRRLMKFPPVEEVSGFISQAVKLKSMENPTIHAIVGLPSVKESPAPVFQAGVEARPGTAGSAPVNNSPLGGSPTTPAKIARTASDTSALGGPGMGKNTTGSVQALQGQVKDMLLLQRKSAEKMNEIIKEMEKGILAMAAQEKARAVPKPVHGEGSANEDVVVDPLTSAASNTDEENTGNEGLEGTDNLMVLVAKMKTVKDVLLGRLPVWSLADDEQEGGDPNDLVL